MGTIIDAAIERSRAVILVLLLIFITGSVAYVTVPKENSPDVQIPIIYVSMTHEGISPEDAERLLIRPMEKELRTIEGVKEMRSNASEGHASVILEFVAGFNSDRALQDVRERVDLARPELPEETDEPSVNEVNFSLFPVLNVIMVSNLPEHVMLRIARNVRDKIEEIPQVLSVDIAGDREEAVDMIIDPMLLESYQLTNSVVEVVSQNNRLVAAGAIDNDAGRYTIKVPGLLESLEDILTLPVKSNGEAIVQVRDIASVRRTFKDHTSFARVNGRASIALEVSKRTGENIIETIDKVRAVVEREKAYWPEGIEIIYAQDQSAQIMQMLRELQNNILFAMLLVMIVIIAVIGVQSAGFVALAIPGAFLIGILAISTLGLTLNIVVLFSLILSIGMLVDSAIVVTEYADRRMMEGVSHKKAYGEAAKRMSWPIIASTITTLLVFAPLLFWPGVVGQFMKYMPLTLIATLMGSLLMALIFIPTLGTWIGRTKKLPPEEAEKMRAIERGDFAHASDFVRGYVGLLGGVLHRPGRFALVILAILIGVYMAYGKFGVGVEFFPEVEPDNVQVQLHARGNLSVHEKDQLVREVEARILDMGNEVKVFYSRVGEFDDGGGELAEDVIGVIQMELQDWRVRRPAKEILAEIRERTADLAGVFVETREEEKGPPVGKPIEVQLSSRAPERLTPMVETILEGLREVGGVRDIEDSRPIPAIAWEMEVDRALAARFGIDIGTIGNFVKLVTNGLVVSTYRPDEADDEVDIQLRFPKEKRGLDQLDQLRTITSQGAVPISNFVTRTPKPKVGRIERVDGYRVLNVKADVEPGVLVDNKVQELASWIQARQLDPQVNIAFKGEDEEQKEASAFLSSAFLLALFSMALVLVTQFNSIYHMLIIMSAVFLSTTGVLLGLLVTNQPFGIVMCGVGVIALSGIVVNNNIIFIDTYQRLRREGVDAHAALLRTGALRLRPILLTAGTTVLGLIPMVVAMNIDFLTREVTFNAPSTQWWRQLSTSIAGGLTFATVLTLFFTPALLLLGERFGMKMVKKQSIAQRAAG